MEKGRQEGIREGIQRGIQEGMQKDMYNIVSNMLKEGMDYELIQQVTELSFDDIQKLIAKSP